MINLKHIIAVISLLTLFSLQVKASHDNKDQANSENSKNKELMNDLMNASLLSLMDFDVELNPDWEAKSPTKLTQKSSSSPANVHVISKDEIRSFGYNQLSEVLSHIAGFVMTSDLSMSNFGARGIHPGARAGSRAIKVMIDGQPISYRSNQQNWMDNSLIPLEMVERIEVTKGPVSALYGANAFLGVVNLVTQNGDELRIKGHIASLELIQIPQANNGYQIAYVGGNQVNNWNTIYGLSFAELDRGGLKLPISSPNYQTFLNDTNHSLSVDSDKSKPLTVYLKSRKSIQNQGFFQIGLHYQELNEDNPFSDLNPLYNTGINHLELNNGFIKLDFNLPLSDSLNLDSHLTYSKGGPKSGDKLELGAEHFYYQRDWGYSAIDFSNELVWQIDADSLVLFGAELNSEEHEIESFKRVERDTLTTSRVSPNNSVKYNNWSIYSQWLYQLNPNINTLFGYRYDKHQIYSAQHSARTGLVWSFNKINYLKLLIGSSFQSPSSELLYRSPVQRGDIAGNPELEPQKAKTIELIYGGTITESLRYDATLYSTKVSDLVKYRNDLDNFQAENATESKTLGLEVNVSYKTQQYFSYANFSWQHTNLDQTSLFTLENRSQPELFPKFSSNFGINYQFSDRSWQISLNNQYVSKRPVSNSNVIISESFYNADDYLNSSLILNKKLYLFKQNETNIQFKINDLFNEKFTYPGFGGTDAPSFGQHFLIKFEQRF